MRIGKLEKIVYNVLKNKPETRSDDFLLIKEVVNEVADIHYLDGSTMSFDLVMRCHKELKLPPFESITRSRRKLQKADGTLANEKVKELREKREEEFINYAHERGC